MSQHACWEWNPETQDANVQILEGSLIWRMWASSPPPHPSEFHQHCQHPPFGLLDFSLSVILNQQPNTSNPKILRQITVAVCWVSEPDRRSIPTTSHFIKTARAGVAYELPGRKLPSTWREPPEKSGVVVHRLGRDHKQNALEAKGSEKHLPNTMGMECPLRAFL